MATDPNPSTPDVHITVNGRPALTTAMAAARHGRELPTMRRLLSPSRYNLEPVHHLDERTPLYDQEAVDELIAALPGRGRAAKPPAE